MKKILITNAFGPQNRGDHELLQQLVQIIRTVYPDKLKIKVFTTYPEESKAVFKGIDFSRSPFHRPADNSGYLLLLWDLFFWVLASYHAGFRQFLSRKRKAGFEDIINADLVVMCPGGYMYSNGLSFYASIVNGIPFRKTAAKKVAAPMSVGPFFSRLDYWLAKRFFRRIDAIHLRESYSIGVVESMGLKPIYTHDLAWWGDTVNSREDSSWQGSFVGTVIDWDYPESEAKSHQRKRYIDEYLQAAEILCRENSGKPLILYNQVGSGDGSSRDELLIAELVKKSEGTIVYDNSACTPEILKARMQMSKGVLASRFHSALFAIQVGTPFVAIAYQPKAEYILKDLNLGEYYRSINDFSGAEVASELLRLSYDSKRFKERLALAKSKTKNNIADNFLHTI